MERRQGGGWVPALAASPQCGQNRAAQGVGLSLSFQQVFVFSFGGGGQSGRQLVGPLPIYRLLPLLLTARFPDL